MADALSASAALANAQPGMAGQGSEAGYRVVWDGSGVFRVIA